MEVAYLPIGILVVILIRAIIVGSAPRRELMQCRREIKRLGGKIQERGLTLIPLKVLINDKGRIKVELALVRGKREYEKREAIKKRDTDREIRAEIKKRLR